MRGVFRVVRRNASARQFPCDAARRSENSRAMAVLLLFFLSGATALIYEVLWSKHLALLLGSTVQAQTVVLVGCVETIPHQAKSEASR